MIVVRHGRCVSKRNRGCSALCAVKHSCNRRVHDAISDLFFLIRMIDTSLSEKKNIILVKRRCSLI